MIVLDDWQMDEQFSPYPEGSRDKYAIFSPRNCEADGIIPDHRYLMKFSNPRYPVQFWSEIIAAIVGRYMGVRVPRCFIATDRATGQPGSLTSWFYGEGAEEDFDLLPEDLEPITGPQTGDSIVPDDAPHSYSRYVAGSAYMVRYIPDYDLHKGRQHNIETLARFLTLLRRKYKLDYWPHWISILVFDAIIGNTDRHQDNWGVLWRRNAQDIMIPRFSPAFDNGTSLLHEILERNLSKFRDPRYRAAYINRGRHHFKWQLSDSKSIQHIELINLLIKERPELQPFVISTTDFGFDNLRNEIMSLPNVTCPVPISEDRCEAMCSVMEDRLTLIRNLLP
jgi:hypothetical protein